MKTTLLLFIAILGMTMVSCSNHSRAKYNDIVITVERSVDSKAIKGDTILAYPTSYAQGWVECSTCSIEFKDVHKVILLGDK